LAKAPKAAGDPAAMLVNNQEHVFYRGKDNNIQHIIWEKDKFRTDSWTQLANRWTQMTGAPKATGDPTAIFANTQEQIFYRDVDNNIQRLYYRNGKFKIENWGGETAEAFGDPTVIAISLD
jgi:hypothetical protein